MVDLEAAATGIETAELLSWARQSDCHGGGRVVDMETTEWLTWRWKDDWHGDDEWLTRRQQRG